nr:RNA-directed DNA polymerase, eukaryota [Tanacetum cinerariifolium]
MSKLDRFLVSINLFNTCPNISAITLERYLSDHRPILLCEQHFDYGPISFKFYHYWMELEGFRNVVEVACKDRPCDDSNAISCFMGKLKFLKNKIREWNKQYMASRKHVKDKYLADLEEVEGIIDSGGGNDEIAMKRAMIVQELQDIDKRNSLELAQKAKLKWAIEGDENNSFFHGMLNKKRNSLSIRGIIVEGVWIDEPKLVKNEFLTHFRRSFSQPDLRRAIVHMNFPNTLSLEQQIKLESMVSNEEIKRAVWDCGLDKAPGPDGFTFGFYRQFCPRGGAEQMQFEELLADIQKVRLTPMVDRWSWKLTSSGEYSMESVRKEIDD